MCPHISAICVLILLVFVLILLLYVSPYYCYICVLMYMCLHTTAICVLVLVLYMCPHTTAICVLILLLYVWVVLVVLDRWGQRGLRQATATSLLISEAAESLDPAGIRWLSRYSLYVRY